MLKKRAGCAVAELATAGLDSIAVRVPTIRSRATSSRKLGRPVVAPSANRSGHVSPTTAEHVLGDLGGRIDLILDGGPTFVGVESTIVALLDRPAVAAPRRRAARRYRTRAWHELERRAASAWTRRADRARHDGLALRAARQAAA